MNFKKKKLICKLGNLNQYPNFNHHSQVPTPKLANPVTNGLFSKRTYI